MVIAVLKYTWFASMKSRWSSKTILITGASGGIGAELAKQLAAKGANLYLCSRSTDRLERLRESLERPEEHKVLPLDVSDPKKVESFLQEHEKEMTQVDVLINNAGISQRALTWQASHASERLIMETNYFGAIALAKAVLPGMIDRNQGMIINMSSVVGKFGFPLRSSYAASKHALHGYFDSLRAELNAQKKAIHVMLVCPGRIATEISLSAVTADGSKQNEMDPGLAKGISPKACASRILRAAERRRAEVYIGKEQFLIYLKRYFPGLFRKLVSKIKPK